MGKYIWRHVKSVVRISFLYETSKLLSKLLFRSLKYDLEQPREGGWRCKGGIAKLLGGIRGRDKICRLKHFFSANLRAPIIGEKRGKETSSNLGSREAVM